MKHSYLYLILPLVALACQPQFDMVPPGSNATVAQEFSDNWYVTLNGSGSKSGVDWNNALPFKQFLKMISNPSTNLSDAGIHIQEGTYVVPEKDGFFEITKDVLCIRGGYSKTLEFDDLSKCDPALYPTVFTGDVNKNDVADDGDGAFCIVKGGVVRFENITFTHFYKSAEMNSKTEGKGGAVFGVDGPYLTTSLECINCQFIGNVNGVAGTSGHEGGAACFIHQGYFKARNCIFKGNAANSRGGAIRCGGKQSVLFMDRCFFTGNSITGEWGSAVQLAEGVVCANNCTMVGNQGKGSTLNGGGAFFLSNNTIIDNSAPNGTSNAAFRCESKTDRGSILINNVLFNENLEGYGLILNSNGTYKSRGSNVVKSISLGNGCTDPSAGEDFLVESVKQMVLTGKVEDNCFVWDIAQVQDNLKSYVMEDDVYNAAVEFDPSAYCSIAVLGRAYATWVTPASFSKDGRGEDRGEDGFQPGSYDPNLD